MPPEFFNETGKTDVLRRIDTDYGNHEAFPRPGEASGLTKREYMATQMMAAYIAQDLQGLRYVVYCIRSTT